MEKSDVQRRRSSPVKQRRWLGTKRSPQELKENYLCKRVANEKIDSRYGKLANTFYNMMAFDWEEEKIGKLRTSIMSNMSPLSYWFYLCTNYFPYESNQFLGNEDEVFEWLNLRVLNTLVENKRQVKKKSQTRRKYSFYKDLKAVVECEHSQDSEDEIKLDEEMHHMEEEIKNSPRFEDVEMKESKINTHYKNYSIDKVISIFEDKIEKVSDKKDNFFEFIISKMKSQEHSLCSLDRSFVNDPEDILIDMKFKNPYAKKFVSYLISKHEKEKISEESELSASNIIKHIETIETNEKEDTNSQLQVINPPLHSHLNPCLDLTNPKVILSRAEEEKQSNPEDVVCLVCNDGDYEDNDLIVYCSQCQMTVHQTCYGIVNIPEDDWICYPCLAFKENSRETICLVCPVIGGAMKPCNVKKSSALYKHIISLRTSPPLNSKNKNSNIFLSDRLSDIPKKNYNLNDYKEKIENRSLVKICLDNYDKNFNLPKVSTCELLSKKEEENLKLTEEDESKSDMTSQSIRTITDDSQLRSELLLKKGEAETVDKWENAEVETNKQTITSSNYEKKRGRRKKQKKKKTPNKSEVKEPEKNEFFNPKIIRENCWVHLSCATWLKDFEIHDYERKQDIRDHIDKTRLTEHCSVCNLSNYGPTLKCGNDSCRLQFHVECARINKYLLEHSVDDKGIPKFYIYCQTHRPHRLVKNTEISRKRMVEDIEAFADILNKNYEMVSKMYKSVDFSIHIPKKYNNPDPEMKKQALFTTSIIKHDKLKRHRTKEKEVIEAVITNKERSRIIHKIREILLFISNMTLNITIKDEECKIAEPTAKPKITVTYQETLNPEIFPWYMLKGTCRVPPSRIYSYYTRELVPNIETYNRIILQKSAGFKVKNKKKKLSKQSQPVEDAKESPFCYCKKDTEEKGCFVGCYYGEEDVELGNKEQSCLHGGWIHKLCVPSLANLDDDYLNSEDFVFACKECIEKFGEPPINKVSESEN